LTSVIDILIQTFNEELNLPHTLESVKGWVRHVYVVDSGSTDRTREIAAEHGATVIEHAWEGYARQKNWALTHIPFESEWILILDADEAVSDSLREELLAMTSKPADQIPEAGFYVNRVFIFFGREIRHCGYFPSWNLRLFKKGKAHYEDRLVHEHMIVDGKSGYLSGLLLHEDRRGLENFFAKHNRYSTLEAVEIYERPEPWPGRGLFSGIGELITNRTVRRRFGKSRILTHLPVPWIWRFIYMWIIRGGILDGRAGWYLCWSISGYEMQVQLKYRELVRLHGDIPEAKDPLSEAEGQLRLHRTSAADGALGSEVAVTGALIANNVRRSYVDPVNDPGTNHHDARPRVDDSDPLKPIPTIVFTKRTVTGEDAKRTEEIVPAFMSPWTFGQNVKRALWMITSKLLFRTSFHNWYGWRRFLLRLFGAKIGQGVRIRPSAYIEIPWNVDIDDGAVVGDWAILYSLGKIRIGKRTVVSQYAHLCAGTHDHRFKDFPLVRPPITIGDDAWVAADAFVGPGVTIGSRSVVGARSNVFSDLPEDIVAVGSPAKPIKAREWIGEQGQQVPTAALQD
jgi:putative colanic acid biosynthesis acetyltransferase WcaF